MSKIDELIQEYCPQGVEFKSIEELGDLYGGITGKSKEDFKDGNARFISYMNVFSNMSTDVLRDDFVKIGVTERQRKLEKSDVLFTGSSENPEECGMSSVILEEPIEPLYLNSFSFFFRLKDTSIFLPGFLKYLFRDSGIRKQINQTASGVTRFNISKKRFVKIEIPVPPLEVQKEIVKILDTFTQLEAELSAELEARKVQYEYYRNQLLTFTQQNEERERDLKWLTLGEIAMYSKTRILAKSITPKTYVGVDNLLQNRQGKKDSGHLPVEGALTEYRVGDILLGNIRPYLKKIWQASNVGGTNGDVLVVRINDSYHDKIKPEFLYHLLASDKFFDYSMRNSKGAKMPRGDKSAILKYLIPVPPIDQQEQVVSVLQRFDKLVNSISEGIPAEITARRKQYEYYRTKLLTFKDYSI